MDALKTFGTSFIVSYVCILLVLLMCHTVFVVWQQCADDGDDANASASARVVVHGNHLLCTDCDGNGGANAKLFDPLFNIRECTKQLILLEDHLAHKSKHCVDCVSKHLLFAEGLLEEAVALDKNARYMTLTTAAIVDIQKASTFFAKHRFTQALKMQQMVRKTRKVLVKHSFDSIATESPAKPRK